MMNFIVTIKGVKRPIIVTARNRNDARLKVARMIASREMFKVSDPQLKPGSLEKSRKIFRGKR